MAKVVWSAGIDSVSGALAKPSKSGQHSCEKMLLGTHRVAASESNDCNRVYIRRKVQRSTVPQAVKARSKDLMQQATDITNFLAQKDTAGGKKTMKAYLWKVCGDAYDAALAGA